MFKPVVIVAPPPMNWRGLLHPMTDRVKIVNLTSTEARLVPDSYTCVHIVVFTVLFCHAVVFRWLNDFNKRCCVPG